MPRTNARARACTLGALACAAVGACSQRSPAPPVIDPGAQNGPGVGGGIVGGAQDASAADAGALDASYLDAPILDASNSGVACAASVVGTAATVDIDQAAPPARWAGPFEIRGTISFPVQVPANTRVVFGLADHAVKSFADMSLQAQGTLAQAAQSATFALHHQTTGYFYLSFVVDMNNDGAVDAGDLGGFYDGAVGAAITDGALATQVVVASAPVCGIDWGLGQL